MKGRHASTHPIWSRAYLGHNNELPGFSIDSLDESGHSDIANANTGNVAHATDRSGFGVGNREQDIGLRLGTTLRCDLRK